MGASALRIVQVINSLDVGGAEGLVVDLSHALKQFGHDVTIVSLRPLGGTSPVEQRARSVGLEVRSIGARNPLSSIFRLRQIAGTADVLHAHLFPAFYLSALVPCRVKIVTEHSPTNRRRMHRLAAYIEPSIYGRYDRCVGISEGVSTALRAHLGGRNTAEIVTIANGIDLGRFKPQTVPASPPGRLRLISVGALDHRKNVRGAIEAVVGLPDVSLTIVGEGPLRRQLELEVRERGGEGQVVFLGMRDDVPELLRSHDALLSTAAYEGFGLAALEAMASGLPALAPAVPGIGNLVEHERSGLLHGVGDTCTLTRQVRALRDDPAMRAGLARGALRRSEEFSITRTARQYAELYRDLTEAAP
ncbi:glycosyltransferase [Actinotalea ferrariae]|uniref:glycosyltransferase n=1 Tax=Actinotalea ferrariae TaxID=1386098 RepID=UPI0009DF4A99|nr:glycosyltransferase [Actinotalea ferrariae]